MKKSKFTEAQIAFVLKQADGYPANAKIPGKLCLRQHPSGRKIASQNRGTDEVGNDHFQGSPTCVYMYTNRF